jgi:hypothetical protein
VKSITDDEAVGDGALRGGRGGAYGLEGEGKEKQTFFWERRQRMKREFTLGFLFGGFFFDLVDERRIRVINQIVVKGREQNI